MKLEDFNYTFIKTLNINVRVSKHFKSENVETGEIVDTYDYKFKQALLSMSDVEDALENIGAVANEVTIFDNPEYSDDYLTQLELNESRKYIEKALKYLFKSYPYEEFRKEFVESLSSNDEEVNYKRYIFSETRQDGYTFDVAIIFDDDLFATEPFYPVRPGAVVNYFGKITY